MSRFRSWLDPATLYGRGALLAGLALSYAGLYQLAIAAGIPKGVAWLYPLSIDMPILAAVESAKRLRVKAWVAALPWVALALFLGFSMWGNAMHSRTDAHGLLQLDATVKAIINAAPPVSVLATHVLVTAMVAAKRTQDEEQVPVAPSRRKAAKPGTGATSTVSTGTASQQPAGTGPASGSGSGGTRTSRTRSGTGTGGKHAASDPVPAPPVRSGTTEINAAGTDTVEGGVVVSMHRPNPVPNSGDAKRLMLAHWVDKVAQGSEPTGADLDRVGGVSAASGIGRRRARQWRGMPLASLKAELAELDGTGTDQPQTDNQGDTGTDAAADGS